MPAGRGQFVAASALRRIADLIVVLQENRRIGPRQCRTPASRAGAAAGRSIAPGTDSPTSPPKSIPAASLDNRRNSIRCGRSSPRGRHDESRRSRRRPGRSPLRSAAGSAGNPEIRFRRRPAFCAGRPPRGHGGSRAARIESGESSTIACTASSRRPSTVEFVDPIAGVGDDELADRAGILAVVIDGVAPVGVMLLREIVVGELAEVIADRAEMVVNHVQHHAQADAVGRVDEAAKIVRACHTAGWERTNRRRRSPSQSCRRTRPPASPRSASRRRRPGAAIRSIAAAQVPSGVNVPMCSS